MSRETQASQGPRFVGPEAAFYEAELRRRFPVAVVGASVTECYRLSTGVASQFVDIPDQPGSREMYERKVMEPQGFLPAVRSDRHTT